MKNNNRNYKGFTTRTININEIYSDMKETLANRVYYQSKQDDLWKTIKRYHVNKSREMDEIDDHIGNCTHKMNQLIGELCKYKKTHKAMNLAYDYLEKEIDRIQRIIDSKNRIIHDVRMGRMGLISSSGVSHTDPSNLINYVAKKNGQLMKLINWRDYVLKYRVR